MSIRRSRLPDERADLEQSSPDGNVAEVQDRLVPLPEVSKLLSVCGKTVLRLVAVGELAAPVKVGKANRWCQSELTAYLEKIKATRNSRH